MNVDDTLEEREAMYGPCELQHELTGKLMRLLGEYGIEDKYGPGSLVVFFNIMQKISRSVVGDYHDDMPVDLAGYAKNLERCVAHERDHGPIVEDLHADVDIEVVPSRATRAKVAEDRLRRESVLGTWKQGAREDPF
jgi:hypothetical protein